MNDRPRRDPTPSGTTSTTFMRIESNLISSTIRARKILDQVVLDQGGIETLVKDCQPRFKAGVSWTIDATMLTTVDHHSRDPLIELFRQFVTAGGVRILVGSARPFVRQAFQVMAMKAGAKLQLFNTMGEIAAELNTAAKPKPNP